MAGLQLSIWMLSVSVQPRLWVYLLKYTADYKENFTKTGQRQQLCSTPLIPN